MRNNSKFIYYPFTTPITPFIQIYMNILWYENNSVVTNPLVCCQNLKKRCLRNNFVRR